jgi:hypothetical protein
MSSSFATAACGLVPCMSRRSTGPPQTRASKARRGSGMRPTAGSSYSSSGSIRESRDRSLAALPRFAISNARGLEIQRDANARLFQAERPRSRQAGLATADPNQQRPVTAAQPKTRWRLPQADDGATSSRL